jgi:hypothetical protein
MVCKADLLWSGMAGEVAGNIDTENSKADLLWSGMAGEVAGNIDTENTPNNNPNNINPTHNNVEVNLNFYSSRFFQGFCFVSIMAVCSALAGVATEFLFSKTDDQISFARKNVYLYSWELAFNAAGSLLPTLCRLLLALLPNSGKLPALFESLPSAISFDENTQKLSEQLSELSVLDEISEAIIASPGSWGKLFDGFTASVWLTVLANVLMGLTVAVIFRYLGNVMKCVGKVVIVYVVTIWIFVETIFLPASFLGNDNTDNTEYISARSSDSGSPTDTKFHSARSSATSVVLDTKFFVALGIFSMALYLYLLHDRLLKVKEA